MPNYLYRQLEQTLRQEIHCGQRVAGDRLPSIRQLSLDSKHSKSTILTAYSRLEAEGLIEARPRSGYFVSAQFQLNALKIPPLSQPIVKPAPVSVDQVLVDIMEQGAAFDLLPLSHHASQASAGNIQLRRNLARAQRKQSAAEQLYYDEPLGLQALREQIAQRMSLGGGRVKADELVISAGCQHALLMALMATTQAGDLVAVESPGFYGVLQLLDVLGLQALELPSSAETGLSPDGLELALQHWDIRALVLSPNYSTPTGACMPETSKQRIVELSTQANIAVIEDDIYGELHFSLERPRTLYSYDKSGSVLLCSSFSKCLSRDLRIGWIAPGRYIEQVKRIKIVSAIASSRTLQQGISQFIDEGGLERHLRQQRQLYHLQALQLQSLIPQYLPMALSCSAPKGGLSLWVELPKSIDSLKLYNRAREKAIALTPGKLFTTQNGCNNFLRMSFMHPWSDERIEALKQLGELIADEL